MTMHWWNALSSVKERGRVNPQVAITCPSLLRGVAPTELTLNASSCASPMILPPNVLEKTIHFLLIGAPQDFSKMFFCFYSEHVREITT